MTSYHFHNINTTHQLEANLFGYRVRKIAAGAAKMAKLLAPEYTGVTTGKQNKNQE